MSVPSETLSTAAFSGAFAFVVAIMATRAIETFGGQRGGLIAALPTTVVPAAFGFARIAGLPMVGAAPADANIPFLFSSTFSVPGGTLVSSLFLLVWRLAPPLIPQQWSFSKALGFMCMVSLTVWFVIAAVLIAVARRLNNPLAFGLTCFCVQLVCALAFTWRSVPSPRGRNPVSLQMMAMRGFLAACAIFFAVLLSAAGGEIAAVASAFPAIFLSIQLALWISQGQAVQGGAVGPVMLGVSSVGSYAMIFCSIAPSLGIVPAMVISWISSVCLCSVPSFVWLTWRAKFAPPVGGQGESSDSHPVVTIAEPGWDVGIVEAVPAAAAVEPTPSRDF
jgi:hypothetical protein